MIQESNIDPFKYKIKYVRRIYTFVHLKSLMKFIITSNDKCFLSIHPKKIISLVTCSSIVINFKK